MNVVAEAANGRIVLYAEDRLKEIVSTIPGARWDREKFVWWLPLSWAACVQLRGVFGPNLQVGQALNEWVGQELANRIQPCLALRSATDADLPMFGTLYPFQRAGVAFMVVAQSALNADEMGLGKSVQAIAATEWLQAQYGNAYPALVVSPNNMKFSWQDEWAQWAPGRKTVVITGTAAKRSKAIERLASGEAEVGIINYEALRAHSRLAGYGNLALADKEREPGPLNLFELPTVIADEAHRVKDPRAKQTRALWAVADSARYRFALTGTPVANSPEDMWTLMRLIAPEEFPVKQKFIDRYALVTYNVFGYPQTAGIKSEHSEELFRFLDPRFIRRTKAAVLPQLPEKVYIARHIELGKTSKQGKAYEQMRKDTMAELDNGTLIASNPLVKLTRLLQFAACYGEMGEPAYSTYREGQRIAGPFATWAEASACCTEEKDKVRDETPLVLTEPSVKVDALEELLLELGDQRAVVFAESRQLIEMAHARLLKAASVKDGPFFGMKFGLVTGSVPELDRVEYVRQFQAGEQKAILLTLAAGGEGLTLTAAQTIIFLQRSWSSVQNLQAEDRVHRIGQTGSVNVIDIITDGTVEEHVHAARAHKAEMLEEFARDEETLKTWLAK